MYCIQNYLVLNITPPLYRNDHDQIRNAIIEEIER